MFAVHLSCFKYPPSLKILLLFLYVNIPCPRIFMTKIIKIKIFSDCTVLIFLKVNCTANTDNFMDGLTFKFCRALNSCFFFRSTNKQIKRHNALVNISRYMKTFIIDSLNKFELATVWWNRKNILNN